ncbi:Hypothetical predicted protein, partial [Drosophila guanche]
MPCRRHLACGATIAGLLLATALIVFAICVQRPNESGNRMKTERKSPNEPPAAVWGVPGSESESESVIGDSPDLQAKAFFLIDTSTTTARTISANTTATTAPTAATDSSSGSLDMVRSTT